MGVLPKAQSMEIELSYRSIIFYNYLAISALKDLAKLVPNVKADFKDLDSPKDDLIIVVDESEGVEDEDKNEEIHSTINDETEDNSASTPLSPRFI
ncbi:hypothetical protein Tco_0548730 [Tanacetum coccineum]